MNGEGFEKLNSAMNVDFVSEIDNVNKQLEEVKQRKNELTEIVNKKEVIFSKEEQGFLITEIKELMRITSSALTNLEQEMRIGCSTKIYEAMSSLANAKITQIKELRELYKTIIDIAFFKTDEDKEEKDNKKTEEVSMTATDLLKIIKEAQKTSSINKIDAEFKVIDEVSTDSKNSNIFSPKEEFEKNLNKSKNKS